MGSFSEDGGAWGRWRCGGKRVARGVPWRFDTSMAGDGARVPGAGKWLRGWGNWVRIFSDWAGVGRAIPVGGLEEDGKIWQSTKRAPGVELLGDGFFVHIQGNLHPSS